MKNPEIDGPHLQAYREFIWHSYHISDRTVFTAHTKPGQWYKKASIGVVDCAIHGCLKISYCLLVIHRLCGRYISLSPVHLLHIVKNSSMTKRRD